MITYCSIQQYNNVLAHVGEANLRHFYRLIF